jgi:hypothetical protein
LRSEVGELDDCKDAIFKALDSMKFDAILRKKES